MNKIGNVVTQKKIKLSDRFNVVTSLSDCDSNIPTLIIGYYDACKMFPDIELIINHRTIDDNTFWTFTRPESVREHESDVELFIDFCYKRIQSKVKYVFVDTIHLRDDEITEIFDAIKNSKIIVGYLHNNRMIYLYCGKVIYGIDLELSKFLGKDPEKVRNRFDKLSNGLLTLTDLPSQYEEDIIKLDNNVKYIPYLCFLDGLNNNS